MGACALPCTVMQYSPTACAQLQEIGFSLQDFCMVVLPVNSSRAFSLTFLDLKISLKLFSSSKLVPMAFLSIRTSDFLIFSGKTPENKEHYLQSIIQTKGDKFDPFSSRFNIKLVEKRNQIGAKMRSKQRCITCQILLDCMQELIPMCLNVCERLLKMLFDIGVKIHMHYTEVSLDG